MRSTEIDTCIRTLPIPLNVDEDGKVIIEYNKELKVKELHYFFLHAGQTGFYYTIKPFFKIKGIREIIRIVIENCEICKKYKYQKCGLVCGRGSLHNDIRHSFDWRPIS